MSKAQIVRYKCCKVVFAACTEPECFTDKEEDEVMQKWIEKQRNKHGFTIIRRNP